MPDAVLTVNVGTLPEGACYLTEQERLIAFAAALGIVLPGNFGTTNQGSTTPSINDRDKPWHRTNVDGSPDGTYYWFDGSWKRKHPNDPGLGGYWRGFVSDIDTIDGGSPGAITTISGPFWEIDTALAAKFPVGVGAFASGDALAVNAEGGIEKVILTMANLPAEPPPLGNKVDQMLVHRTSAGQEANNDRKGLAQNNSDHVYRTNSEVDHADNALGNLGTATAHTNIPPCYAVYFLRRTARVYYSI